MICGIIRCSGHSSHFLRPFETHVASAAIRSAHQLKRFSTKQEGVAKVIDVICKFMLLVTLINVHMTMK